MVLYQKLNKILRRGDVLSSFDACFVVKDIESFYDRVGMDIEVLVHLVEPIDLFCPESIPKIRSSMIIYAVHLCEYCLDSCIEDCFLNIICHIDSPFTLLFLHNQTTITPQSTPAASMHISLTSQLLPATNS